MEDSDDIPWPEEPSGFELRGPLGRKKEPEDEQVEAGLITPTIHIQPGTVYYHWANLFSEDPRERKNLGKWDKLEGEKEGVRREVGPSSLDEHKQIVPKAGAKGEYIAVIVGQTEEGEIIEDWVPYNRPGTKRPRLT